MGKSIRGKSKHSKRSISSTRSKMEDSLDNSIVAWDWNAMNTGKGRARAIMNSGYLSDGTIILTTFQNEGNEKCYNVHRIFLESTSPTFQRLFREGELHANGGKSTIHISDISVPCMDAILKYAYLDEVEVGNLDQSLELLGSANKYEIVGLIKLLSPRIIHQIKPENVLKIYKYAYEWTRLDIMSGAMDIICRYADSLIETIEFLELPEECLLEILKRDELQISSELKLFQAVRRWGEIKCEIAGINPTTDDNLRGVLKNAVGLIRFPLMDKEEFTLNVGVNNVILNLEDMVAILLYFTVPMSKRGGIPPGRFISKPRCNRRSNSIDDGEIIIDSNYAPLLDELDSCTVKTTASNVAPFPDLRNLIEATNSLDQVNSAPKTIPRKNSKEKKVASQAYKTVIYESESD